MKKVKRAQSAKVKRTGPSRRTAAQRKAIDKRAAAHTKAARKVSRKASKIERALQAKCPTCRAAPGVGCFARDGRQVPTPHRLRMLAMPTKAKVLGPFIDAATGKKFAGLPFKAAPAPAWSGETLDPKLIKIGKRHRKDYGDLDELARSIDDRGGLLQPVAITAKRELIAGERRLLAWPRTKFAGQPIPVHVLDVDAIVAGEADENFVRKSFTRTEAVAIKRSMENVLRRLAQAEAAARPSETRAAPGRKAEPGKRQGRVADKVATLTGVKRSSLERAEKIVEAAEADPARFGPLAEQMDRSGSVNAAWKKLQVMQATDKIKAAPPVLPMNARECTTWSIDFPWHVDLDGDQDALDAAGRSFRPYPEMTIKTACQFAREQIVPNLPGTVSIWLHVTNFILVRGYHLHVYEALGFKPENACTLLTWNKVKLGRGTRLREVTEHAILLTRGPVTINPYGEDPPTTSITEARRENSRKPDKFWRLAERVTPAKRYCSVFSQGGEGELWDGHGDQIGKFAPSGGLVEPGDFAGPVRIEREFAVDQGKPSHTVTVDDVKRAALRLAPQVDDELRALERIAAAPGAEQSLSDALRAVLVDGKLVAGKRTLRLTKAGKARLAELRQAEDSDPAVAERRAEALFQVLECVADGRPLDEIAADPHLVDVVEKAKWVTGKKAPRLTKAGLARLAELREDRAERQQLAALPDDLDRLVALYAAELRKRHDAILGGYEIDVGIHDRGLDLLQAKANGGTNFGQACDDSPAERLRAVNAAPLGKVPMWGQRGIFELDIDGVPYLVAHDEHDGFAAHAVDLRLPFISETGYRSLGREGPALGVTVEAQAEAYIREAIVEPPFSSSGRKKKPRTVLPFPATVYRMPHTWGEAVEPVVADRQAGGVEQSSTVELAEDADRDAVAPEVEKTILPAAGDGGGLALAVPAGAPTPAERGPVDSGDQLEIPEFLRRKAEAAA